MIKFVICFLGRNASFFCGERERERDVMLLNLFNISMLIIDSGEETKIASRITFCPGEDHQERSDCFRTYASKLF